ncbi:MAG TPA: hypothetical protein VLC09_14580 [Polyangiaceae bacterium]|nr:hypothetical protein [Polyangiaceae bacterium]
MTSSRGYGLLALAYLAGSLLPNVAVAAEASAENKAAARELATEGIKLAQAGNCKEALPKLEKAETLYHAVTILTWVGECQIKEGQLVAGTENLNKVSREELPANAPQAFSDAKKRANTLLAEATPRIGRLTLNITPADAPELQVTIDGRPYSAVLLGSARPTDPGSHEIVATAPGYKEARGTVVLQEAGREELKLTLEVDPNAKPVVATETPNNTTAQPQDQGSSGNTQRTLGWVGIGVGAAAIIGGGITGGMAIGAKGQLDTLCNNQNCSSDAGIAKLNEANALALTSTILFSAGGALAATGVILLLTGGNGTAEAKIGSAHVQPQLGFGQGGLTGKF